MESKMTALTSDARIPAVPHRDGVEIVTVLNSMGAGAGPA